MNKYAFFTLLKFAVMASLFIPSSNWASQIEYPLEKAVCENPVIVIGKIEEIRVAPPLPESDSLERELKFYRTVHQTLDINRYASLFDTAFICVSEVLKNELGDSSLIRGKRIPVLMPSIRRPIISNFNVYYPLGASGVWIFKLWEGEGLVVSFPQERQPFTCEEEIRRLIARKQKEDPNLYKENCEKDKPADR